jgi:potassium efflux system protein
MTAFGESSVDWELAIWIDDAWELRPAQSRVHEAVWEAFHREGIVIAFPQVDLHLDPPVMQSIERLAAGRVA